MAHTTARSLLELVKQHGVVREAHLAELLASETGGRPEVDRAEECAARRGLSRVLACIQGCDEDALIRIMGSGGKGGGPPVPRVMVLALLHLAAQLQHQNGHSTFGALAAHSPFMAAFEAEMHRARRLVAGAHKELLARLADLGRQLPPTVSAAVTCAPPSSTVAAEVAACAALRAAADRAASDLVALDDLTRSAVQSMAHLAAAYDNALLGAAAATTHMFRDSGEDGDAASPCSWQQQRQQQRQPWWRRWQQPRQRQEGSGMLDGAPVTAVVSHSAPGQQGKYVAGVAPDVYHQAAHRIITGGGAAASEPALWALSALHARIRHREAAALEAAAAGADGSGQSAEPAATTGAAEWKAPDKFTRSTTKYWVRPAHVLRVKAALCRHLPLLVYGAKSPVHQGDIDSPAAIQAGAQAGSTLVSSVYFDSEGLASYHARLAKEDGARAVRMRWYGPRRPDDGGQAVFVERKTHREPWTGERSVKERASLRQEQVAPFLCGAMSPCDLGKGSKAQLLTEVQQHLARLEQGPSVRTEYVRSAWQAYDSAAVRVSLDDHMLLLRERGAHKAPGDWCAALETAGALPGGDAVRFPYSVLEIKLASDAKPAWINELLASGLLVEVPRFSKFLHGSALLFPAACATTPPWFLPDELDCGRFTPATADEMEVRGGCPRCWVGCDGGEAEAIPPPPWLVLPGSSGAPLGPLSASTGNGVRLGPLSLNSSLKIFARRGRPAPAAAPGASLSSFSFQAASNGFSGRTATSCGSLDHLVLPILGPEDKEEGASADAAQPAGPLEVAAFSGGAASQQLQLAGQGGLQGAQQAIPGAVGAGPQQQEGSAAPASVAISIEELMAEMPLLSPNSGSRGGRRGMESAGANGLLCGDTASVGAHGGRDQASATVSTAAAKPQVVAAASASKGACEADERLSTSSGGTSGDVRGGGRRARLLRGARVMIAQKMRLLGGRRAGGGAAGAAGVGALCAPVSCSQRQPNSTAARGSNDHLQGFTGKTPRSQQLVRARIEPKTFFANERTFLQWLNISVLVAMTGLGLLTGSSVMDASAGSCWDNALCRASRVSGAAIAPTSVVMMGYALYIYKKRAAQILAREAVRYDDRYGPAALTVLLLVVVTLAIVLSASSLGGWGTPGGGGAGGGDHAVTGHGSAGGGLGAPKSLAG